ncbi:GbsR/MarR family transcriptional regulator [Novosphingobium mangrovi (ex Huang et al. 2023)]|uniref:Transcriptional regulator n=1 Tax=Novosphingobium mangrovi (ex Huang et al. 2023) TaxID=2976432 RepID=A0ABT2I1U4_9SPHN|nr:transcriptional regulator [Novosphingobium mangrovi (ex Huang et al. 2023)]MCT2398780.1 transcriptional regulator [Novosphingobium mangrovi (ex Huang et al. 2023)]
MPNISNHSLNADQRRFIDEMAALLTPWGMQPGTASLYAYLLICDEPVSLDAIAATLGMAKSSVSVAGRALEQFGLARRHSEPGSKRVRYGASDSYSGFLVAQAGLLDEMGRLAQSRAPVVAEDETMQRLRYLGAFHRKMAAAITGRISELHDEFLTHGPDEDLR